jgi:cystathionine beta-lyase
MANYDFDTLPLRRGTDSGKWGKYKDDVLPMWVADMDFRSPEPVILALHARVEHGVFGYPLGLDGDPRENMAIRQVIIERLARLYGWQVLPEELVFIPGVVTGFNLACQMVSAPQAGVLVQTPVYHPILHAPEYTGMLLQEAQLVNQDLHYSIDFEAFEAAITAQTRLFILCNPHNPVGRVYTHNDMASLAEICLRKGLLICSDEIHSDLVYPPHRHIPLASLDPQIARKTITLMAPSKTFNLPGLKFSFAIIQNPELRKRYQRAGRALVGWINIFGWTAALAAYQEGQDWLDQLLVYLQANRDFLSAYLRREIPGVAMREPEGTYLAWLDCRHAGIPGNPYEFFLEKARVAFNDGKIFGSGGEGFVRLNFGCPRSMLVEALQRMKTALGGAGL